MSIRPRHLIAAHGFGYGEANPEAGTLGTDPVAWVLQQFDRAQEPDSHGLLDSKEAAALSRRALQAEANAVGGSEEQVRLARNDARRELRRANVLALQRRWQHMAGTSTPVVERWVAFWSNHFSVSASKAAVAGLVLPYEREAIRPHCRGRFVDLLRAATTHPAMLLYLDNAQSIGPRSRAGSRRERGLNENLGRELLELHTLGVNGGYSQSDVTETARLLTGWTVRLQDGQGSGFVAAMHEPGDKRILGRRYHEGAEALELLLHDLARHPSTATLVATKLARHFVSDEPPPALVDHLSRTFRDSDGDLRQLARALFSHALSWSAQQAKFKRPEDWIISAHRVLQQPVERAERWWQAAGNMGQLMLRAPSPQGWPDRDEDWLSPDALWKRAEFAALMGQQWGNRVDARAAAARAHAGAFGEASRLAIERAESPAQALALWLASPEFLRR